MNARQRYLLVLMVAACSQAASAQESVSWWSRLNPFSKQAPAAPMPVSPQATTRSPGVMGRLPKPRLPKLPTPRLPRLPGADRGPELTSPTAPRPNPIQRLGQGAKGVLTKTTGVITRPFQRNSSDGPPAVERSADRRAGSPGGFFGGPRTSSRPPQNATEFLKQPRVAP